jgi:hypothetical protein
VIPVKWDEVRELYPDQWVKVKVLNSHTDEGYLYIDEMEIVKSIDSDKEATLELTKSIGDNLVFHTSHDIIKTKLIKSLGLFSYVNMYVGSVANNIDGLLGLDVLLNKGAIIDLNNMEIRFE